MTAPHSLPDPLTAEVGVQTTATDVPDGLQLTITLTLSTRDRGALDATMSRIREVYGSVTGRELVFMLVSAGILTLGRDPTRDPAAVS